MQRLGALAAPYEGPKDTGLIGRRCAERYGPANSLREARTQDDDLRQLIEVGALVEPVRRPQPGDRCKMSVLNPLKSSG